MKFMSLHKRINKNYQICSLNETKEHLLKKEIEMKGNEFMISTSVKNS